MLLGVRSGKLTETPSMQIRSRNFATNSFAVETPLKNLKRDFQSLTFTAEDCNVTSTRRKDGLMK